MNKSPNSVPITVSGDVQSKASELARLAYGGIKRAERSENPGRFVITLGRAPQNRSLARTR